VGCADAVYRACQLCHDCCCNANDDVEVHSAEEVQGASSGRAEAELEGELTESEQEACDWRADGERVEVVASAGEGDECARAFGGGWGGGLLRW